MKVGATCRPIACGRTTLGVLLLALCQAARAMEGKGGSCAAGVAGSCPDADALRAFAPADAVPLFGGEMGVDKDTA